MIDYRSLDTEGTKNLANAIIVQAANDYREDVKNLKKLLKNEPKPDPPKKKEDKSKTQGPHEKWERRVQKCRDELDSIEEFFYSSRFEILSDTDGPALFQKLKEEAESL